MAIPEVERVLAGDARPEAGRARHETCLVRRTFRADQSAAARRIGAVRTRETVRITQAIGSSDAGNRGEVVHFLLREDFVVINFQERNCACEVQGAFD